MIIIVIRIKILLKKKKQRKVSRKSRNRLTVVSYVKSLYNKTISLFYREVVSKSN